VNPDENVPLEATGLTNPYISHWRQFIFGRVTVAALHDLGYQVNPEAAETDLLMPGPLSPEDGGEIEAEPALRAAAPPPGKFAGPPWYGFNCGVRFHPECEGRYGEEKAS
jgi:hypothetical protein